MLLQKIFHVIIMLLQKGYHRILGAFGIKEKKEEEPIIETGRRRQYHCTGCKQYFSYLLGYNIYHFPLKFGHHVIVKITISSKHFYIDYIYNQWRQYHGTGCEQYPLYLMAIWE